MRFDQLAYSLLSSNVHFHNVDRELSYIKSLLDTEKIKIRTAIDIGCGDGSVTQKMQKILNLKTIHGLDINRRLLKMAQKKGIKTIKCNANEINLSYKFDLIISYGSLHHMENTRLYFKNLKKICARYFLLADCTVRDNLVHRFMNSKFFRFDASSFPIRNRKHIREALDDTGYVLREEKTNYNASIWFDRSIFLASV